MNNYNMKDILIYILFIFSLFCGFVNTVTLNMYVSMSHTRIIGFKPGGILNPCFSSQPPPYAQYIYTYTRIYISESM